MPHLLPSSDHASHRDHCADPDIANDVGNVPVIRVSLQRWGIAADALRAMVATLNAADQRIVWSDHEDGVSADMIVHMVNMEGLAGPSLQAPGILWALSMHCAPLSSKASRQSPWPRAKLGTCQ